VLTLEDCIALSELTEEEVLAIAEHEHIPEMAAVELGSYLVRTPAGETRVGAMLRDDIDRAREAGDHRRAAVLRLCLQHYLQHHPARS
jgi:hypothetical protein